MMLTRFPTLVSFGTILALCSACGEAPDGTEVDTLGTTELEFGEASCATATPDKSLGFPAPGQSVVEITPTTYNNANCYRSYVFNLDLPTEPSLSIDWTDPWPRNQAQCLGTMISMAFYPPPDRFFPVRWDAESVWENGACKLGSIRYYTIPGLSVPRVGRVRINDQEYATSDFGGVGGRLAVTARTAANNTQSVKVTVRNNGTPACPTCPP